MATVLLSKQINVSVRKVTLVGTKPIMFDRYAGDNNTKLEPWQKLYLSVGDEKIIGLPSINMMSFFTAHNTNSAPKRLRDKRKYKDIANACLAFLEIEEEFIPFTRNGKIIKFGRFVDGKDPSSGVFVHHTVARLEKGIPNLKERPVLPLPWELSYTLRYTQNKEVQEQEVLNLLEEGGRTIGLGTFRGLYGKFVVTEFD